MPLNLQMLINNDLLDELAKCFNKKSEAERLLTAIDFPVSLRPNFDRADNSMEYWLKVCEQIDNGIIAGGFEVLLAAAAKRFPANTVFAPIIRTASPVNATVVYPIAVVSNYDVFTSYSSRDRNQVREIVNALRLRSVKPWMDESDLTPGSSFVQVIEQVLTTIKTVAIFWGPNGFGPWQRVEFEAVFDRAVKNQCLIIPILLPGAKPDDLPLFLKRLNYIRINNGLDTAAIDKLADEIIKQRSRRP